jgi:hypothetical protein
MELDDDSDDGGCLDGWEDANKNGRFEQGPGETDNFEKHDDPCLSGTFTNNADIVTPPIGNQGRRHFQQRHTARFSMRLESDGTLRGRGHVWFSEDLANSTISEWEGRPLECKYTMVVGPVEWRVELTAETKTLADGSLEVALRASPATGPSFTSTGRNQGPSICGPFATTVTSVGHPWPMLGPYKLVNGLFRHVYTGVLPPNSTGTIGSEVVVKMKQRM